jgi:hypothetical protein
MQKALSHVFSIFICLDTSMFGIHNPKEYTQCLYINMTTNVSQNYFCVESNNMVTMENKIRLIEFQLLKVSTSKIPYNKYIVYKNSLLR